MVDLHTKGTKFPKLVYKSVGAKDQDNRLLVGSYEMGPLDKPDDYYATLEIKPLEIIYPRKFIDRICNYLVLFCSNIFSGLYS